MWGTFMVVSMTRTVIFGGLYWVPPVLGKCHFRAERMKQSLSLARHYHQLARSQAPKNQEKKAKPRNTQTLNPEAQATGTAVVEDGIRSFVI